LSEPAPLDEARRFLSEHIATYDELDVLLCLRRRRDLDLEPSYFARDLGIPEAVCRLVLEQLCVRRLAARSAEGKAFRFSPATDSLASGVLALEQAYHLSPVSVIRAMSENALQRVRASAVRAFPDPPPGRRPR